MMDGSSPSLPVPPADTLFSLPQLGFLHPPPTFVSFPQLSLQTAAPAKVTPSTATQPFAHPKTHSTSSPHLPLNPSGLDLFFTQYGLSWPQSFQSVTVKWHRVLGAARQGHPGLSECG